MEIPDIKARVSIGSVLAHYGLQPDRHGRLLCPFHHDTVPSLHIYPATNRFACFSSQCSAGSGDVIDFIRLKENCTAHAAIETAKTLAGAQGGSGEASGVRNPGLSVAPAGAKAAGRGDGATPPEGVEYDRVVSAVPALSAQERSDFLIGIFQSFQRGAQTSPKAQEYIKARKLDSALLRIGYNSGQFHQRGNTKVINTALACGLLSPRKRSGYYNIFGKDCIVFPLQDKAGNIASLYFRSIHAASKTPHLYLKERQGLYPHYPKPGKPRLILTESIIDAATLLAIPAIVNNYGVLACYGTEGIKEQFDAIIYSEHIREIIFFFDGDAGGKKAVEKHSEDLLEQRPTLAYSTVQTPEGEDINSLAISHEPEIFVHLLDKRTKLFTAATDGAEGAKPPTAPEAAATAQVPVKQKGAADAPPPDLSLSQEQQQQSDSLSQEEPRTQENPPQTPRLNTANPDAPVYRYANLHITVQGGINVQYSDRLRVTLKLHLIPHANPARAIRHSLDLYNDDQLERFIRKAAEKLEYSSVTISRAVACLTEELEAWRERRVLAMHNTKAKRRELTPERIKAAVDFLTIKELLRRTNEYIGHSGVIGEEINRLLMYLVFTSRLRERPLHIISLGSSGSGKTYLQERIAELIPAHDKIEITILSENAFYYFGREELSHKLVLIEDMDGAGAVLYPLRELQSKQRITKGVTLKSPQGRLETVTLEVAGPICLAGTTTRERLYEDNANRAFLISPDAGPEQQTRIMNYRKDLSAGLIDSTREQAIKEFFKDVQCVLKPVAVRNPYAPHLRIPTEVFKPLRTLEHYLLFIETITFYHQYQREVKTDPRTGEQYIETTLEDIAAANALLKDVLLAKSDELNGACRRFFEDLKVWLAAQHKTSFYRGEYRGRARISPATCKRHIADLVRHGYLRIAGGNPRRKGFEYAVTDADEYRRLQSSVQTALDVALANIEKRLNSALAQQNSGSVAHERLSEEMSHLSSNKSST